MLKRAEIVHEFMRSCDFSPEFAFLARLLVSSLYLEAELGYLHFKL